MNVILRVTLFLLLSLGTFLCGANTPAISADEYQKYLNATNILAPRYSRERLDRVNVKDFDTTIGYMTWGNGWSSHINMSDPRGDVVPSFVPKI